jgi:predicted ribosome quality control (RQC) complex YloA/Tae2 family protein
MLLKVGRHLRPRPHFKIIVGREEGENRFLEGYRKRFVHMFPTSHSGPLVLLDGEISPDDMELAARLTARFSQGRDAGRVTIEVHGKGVATHSLDVVPLSTDEIPAGWYI